MSDTSRVLRTGWLWGICAIISEVMMMLASHSIQGGLNGWFSVIYYEFIIGIVVITFTMHTWAFRAIGRKVQSTAISVTATIVAVVNIFFGLSLLLSGIAYFLGYDFQERLTNGFIGIFLVLYVVVGLFFSVAILLRHRQIGILGVFGSGIVIVFPFGLWAGWPMIILLTLSTLFFYQKSKDI